MSLDTEFGNGSRKCTQEPLQCGMGRGRINLVSSLDQVRNRSKQTRNRDWVMGLRVAELVDLS